MNIAVVGDIHGHLSLTYAVLGKWQIETGRKIDVILQCGDMGAFLATSQLDRATTRRKDSDPEELGFAQYVGANPPATLLDPRPLMVFIPGNHEDFSFLEERDRAAPPSESIYPVSDDGKISALRSGRIWTFGLGDERVRVAGISGIAGGSLKKSRHPRYHISDDDSIELAATGAGSIDILISHDGPTGVFTEGRLRHAGSSALRFVIREAQPKLAFFAHYDHPGEWEIGNTRVFALNKCGYVTTGSWPVTEGGVAIVTWNTDSAVVERIDADWLRAANRNNWRHWESRRR
jgi:Icc-related predicted phosphoesterase